MTKPFFLVALFSFFASSAAIAECSADEESLPLDVVVEVNLGAVKAGGNHGYFDQVTVSAPKTVGPLSFQGFTLTAGEVAEFWVPLAHEQLSDRVRAEFLGRAEVSSRWEVLVEYSSPTCHRLLQYEIGA